MPYLRHALRILILWAALAALFTAGICLSQTLGENKRVLDNAVASLKIIDSEGQYPARTVLKAVFENFTDALMISAATAPPNDGETLVETAFAARCSFGEYGERPLTVAQKALASIADDDYSGYAPYGRYWHGYLLTLRPALYFTDIKGMRAVNAAVLCALVLAALGATWRRVGLGPTLCLSAALAVVWTWYVPDSLMYCTCFFIALGFYTWLMAAPPRWLSADRCALIFFTIGALTSYFDLLSTPLITFGLPVTAPLLRRKRMPDYRFLIGCLALWCAGYAGLWATKWLLTALFTPLELMESTLAQIRLRTTPVIMATDGLIPPKALWMVKRAAALAALTVIAALIAYCRGRQAQMVRYSSFAVLASLPVLWALALQDHSFIHVWFVWRIGLVSVLGCLLFIFYTFKTSHHPS